MDEQTMLYLVEALGGIAGSLSPDVDRASKLRRSPTLSEALDHVADAIGRHAAAVEKLASAVEALGPKETP